MYIYIYRERENENHNNNNNNNSYNITNNLYIYNSYSSFNTPGLHNKIPANKIFARVWVAQEPICS